MQKLHTDEIAKSYKGRQVVRGVNLEITQGLICTEAVMMRLAPHLGRQRAHDLVYDISRQVSVSGRPLLDLLAENEEIASSLARATLAKLLDPAEYLGLSGAMVDRVLG